METKNNRISLCMIVRDEEQHLGRCLASAASLVHEIIVVDTGSHDRTKDIAGQFGCKVFDFVWTDDFAAARNFGLEQASGEWLLVLDADEYLEEATAAQIINLTTRQDAADAYLLPLKNLMIPELGEWQTSLVLRLFKNSPDFRFQGKIHEQIIVPSGKTVEIAEQGPNIIHLGYIDSIRLSKSRRNMEMLKKALAAEPGQPYYHYYISTEYINQGDFINALDHICLALSGIPQEVVLFRTAAVRNAVLCLMNSEELDEAEKLLKSEIETFDEFPDLYYYLGNIYMEKGNYPQAIDSFNKALSIKEPSLIGCSISGSNGYKSLFHRGLCQEKLRRYFEAIESFRAAMDNNPSFDVPLPNLMKCLLLIGGATSCLRYLDNHFTIVSPQLLLLAARLLFTAGYPELARRYADQTDDSYTGFGKSLLLGEIALAEGNPKEAITHFKKIPSENPLFAASLVFQCICAWKLEISSDTQLITKLARIQPNQPVAKLLKYLNSVFFEKDVTPLKIKSKKQAEVCLKFGLELFIKLAECKMFRQAEILGQWLIGVQPELRWDLAYNYRKAGALQQAASLQECRGNIGEEPFYLAKAELYEKLSNEFLDRVPVLPERPY